MNNLARSLCGCGKCARRPRSLITRPWRYRVACYAPTSHDTQFTMLSTCGLYNLCWQISSRPRHSPGRHPEIIVVSWGPTSERSWSPHLANAYGWRVNMLLSEELYTQVLATSRRVLGPRASLYACDPVGLCIHVPAAGKYALAERHAARRSPRRRGSGLADMLNTMMSAPIVAFACLSSGEVCRERAARARRPLEFDRKIAAAMTGNDSAPRACWAPAWPDRRNTPKPNRCCSKATGGWWRADHIAAPDAILDRAREWIVQLYQSWGETGPGR